MVEYPIYMNKVYSTKYKILDVHSLSFDYYSEISVARYRAWFGTKRSQVQILYLRLFGLVLVLISNDCVRKHAETVLRETQTINARVINFTPSFVTVRIAA